jgi:hypothetical protein
MIKKREGAVLRFKEWLAMEERRQALIRRIKRTMRFYRSDDGNLVVTASRSDC